MKPPHNNNGERQFAAIDSGGDHNINSAKLSRFFDLSLDMLCIFGFDGYFKELNPAWTQILGYSVESLKQQPLLEFVHPDDVPETRAQARRLVEGQRISGFENRCRCKDGSYRWLSWKASPAMEEELVYAVVQDVTDRHRMEMELRQSEELYRQMFEKHSSIRLLIDPTTGAIVDANHAAAEFYGYSIEQLTQMNIGDINQLSSAEVQQEMEQARLEKRNYFIFSHRLASGEVRDMEVHSHPIVVKGRKLLYSLLHDITQRRQAQRRLQQQSEFQTALLNNANYGIIATNEEGIIQSFNRSAEEMLGYTAEEVVGQVTPLIFHDPDELAARAQQFSEMLGLDIEPGFELFAAPYHYDLPNEHEWTYIHKDGSTFPVLISISAMRNARGQPVGFLGIASDITERKRSEQALRHSEARNRALLDAIPDLMFQIDVAGKFVAYKASTKDLYVGTQSIIGSTVYDLLPQYLADITMQYLRNALATDEAQTYEYELPPGDATNYFEARMVKVNATEVLAIVRNITEQKKAEHELNHYRNQLEARVADRTRRLELIALLSGQLNSILDLDDLLLNLVNMLQHSFGYYHVHFYLLSKEGDELIMRAGAGEIGAQLKAQGHRLRMGQGIVGTVAESQKASLNNDVNEVAHFYCNPLLPDTRSELAVPLCANDLLVGVLDVQSNRPNAFSVEDISMLRTLADQTAIAINNVRLLNERQATIVKLRAVDEAKSQFITMISHELRTPLQAINGFTELLLLGLSGDLPEAAHSDIQLIHNNGRHLLDLINDVLDIAQIEEGTIQMRPRQLQVQELVHEVLTDAGSLVREQPVTLVTEVAENLSPVYADPTRLKQILFNLVSNGIKFTPQGQVTVEVVTDPHDAQMARFAVRDTGIGIAEGEQKAIFEHFRQADMSDARKYSGIGVGLSTCKLLVEMQGGTIDVRSEEGVGSEFYFTIPFATQRI